MHCTALQIKAAQVFGIIGYVLSGLMLCLALFMRKRISLANGIMKESARAINAVPLMTLMPIISAIATVAFFIPFVYYGESHAQLLSVVCDSCLAHSSAVGL
jgi:uncharacterized membrane protein